MTKKITKKESTAVLAAPKGEEKAIAAAQQAIADISVAMDIKVNSEPTMKKAGEYMNVIAKAKKIIEGERTGIVKPINDSVKRINELFKPIMEEAVRIESYLKGELNLYVAKLQKEQDLRAAEANKQIESGERIAPAVKKFENTTAKLEQIPTRIYYITKVVDFSKVPDQYKILDETKAEAANKAGIEVPGLEFSKENRVINNFR